VAHKRWGIGVDKGTGWLRIHPGKRFNARKSDSGTKGKVGVLKKFTTSTDSERIGSKRGGHAAGHVREVTQRGELGI